MKRLVHAILFVGLTALGPIAARANLTPIISDVAADWKHALTGMTFPSTLAGFSRSRIEDYGDKQLDIAGTYDQSDSKTTATVYLYRAGLADASVWHDRIVAALSSGRLGSPDNEHAIAGKFSPKGHGDNSGLQTSFPMSGKDWTSSGVAIFSHDDWLISIRMTSATLSAPQLADHLKLMAETIPLPNPKVVSTEPYAMSACADTLPDQSAKRAKNDMASSLLAGLLMQTVDNLDEAPVADTSKAAELKPWCRDSHTTLDYGVYRTALPADGYIVAIGDAGNTISINPDAMATLLNKNNKNRYSVMLTTTESRDSYPSFVGMPSVDQVIKLIGSENPAARTSRPIGGKKDTTITISPK